MLKDKSISLSWLSIQSRDLLSRLSYSTPLDGSAKINYGSQPSNHSQSVIHDTLSLQIAIDQFGLWTKKFAIIDAERRQKKKMLVDYLYINLKNHNFWTFKYFFCAFLGLLNISDRVHLLITKINCPCLFRSNVFNGQIFYGTFLTFGFEVLSFADGDQEDRIDPMVKYGVYCHLI